MRWWIGLCLGLVLRMASSGYTDDRRGSRSQLTSIGRARAHGDLTAIGAGIGNSYLIASPSTNRASVKDRERVGHWHKCREYRC